MRSRILLLENDPDLGTIARAALEAQGYRLDLARTIREAIARCSMVKPDLVLIDLHLTGESGWEFIRWVGDNVPDLRVAAYSVHASESEHRDLAKTFGLQAMIPKTGDPSSLVEAVEALLATPSTT